MSLRQTIRTIQRLIGVPPDGIFGPVTARATLAALDEDGGTEPAHEAGEIVFDARTERNLATLDSKAQRRFRPFIAKAKAVAATMGCDYVAISGHRSWDEQDRLYAKGRTSPGPRVTNARGGQSNHNFGIALDFGVFRGGRYLDSADPPRAGEVHRAVSSHAAAHGLEWGGAWRSFKDAPHFEVRTGLTMAEKRREWKARRSVL